jgi:hypothetical protein
MKKVQRNELLDIGAYEEIRERFRAVVIEEKKSRRFALCDELSVVFENRETVLLQVQEMLRTERITKESGIRHELDTYNELIPGADELSATLFVEIADRDTRDRRLIELAGLEATFAIEVDGQVVAARNETRGVLPDRTTAVHYLKFPLGPAVAERLVAAARHAGGAPVDAVALLVRHPHLKLRAPLPAAVLRSVAEDLAEIDPAAAS